MNKPLWFAALILAVAGLTGAQPARAQASCSNTYDSTKKYCAPLESMEWQWFWRFGNNTEHGPFESESAALADLEAVFLPTQQWCDMTLDYMNYDTTPTTSYGMPAEYFHGAHYNVTIFKNDPAPCQRHTTAAFAVRQSRKFACPKSRYWGESWALITSGPMGPHCEIPWTGTWERADCSVSKGNPCDVLDGSKVQTERDYIGAGTFPLAFVRTYESRIAFRTYQGGVDQEHMTPLGIGWSASYFQSIRYTFGGQTAGASVLRPNGRRIYFNENAGVMSAQAGVVERLEKLMDGSGTHSGWKLTLPDDTAETYDATGRLTSIRNRMGLTQSLNYVADLRTPQSVVDSFGRTLTFAYDGNAPRRLQTITLPDGSQIGFSYDSSQNLIGASYPGGVARQYHYELTVDRKNLLTGITDESGVRYATWTYHSSASGAAPTSSKHAGDVDLYAFTYTAPNTRIVLDPLGQSRTYGGTTRKGQRLLLNSTAVTMGSTEAKALTYDNHGNVVTRKDFNNNQTNYIYDLSRELETSRTEAYGTSKQRVITTQWHAEFRLPTIVEDPLSRTTMTYDIEGNLLSRTVLDLATLASRTWTYSYNSYGQILTVDGPRNDASDVTTYSYYTCILGYECGQLQTVTDALNHTTTYNSYNAHGQPTQITDPNGLVTSMAYDPRQRLTDRCVGGSLPTCSGGELTHLDYWPTGLLKKVTNPDGSYISYLYDAAHRLTEIQDSALNRIVYTLDNMGNRTAENTYDPSNALRRTHSRVYNTLNQLWKDVNAANTAAVTTTFGYDNNGNQTTTAAPLARNSTSLYDELNRLKQITDPASGITQFGYDANDNLTSVTDPRSLVTSYTYSGFGDLLTQTSPDTGLTTNTYDSGGNLDTSTDARGVVTDYDYDVANRVSQVSYTLGGITDQTITYGYDAGPNGLGRLTSASDANHSLAWAYDTHGRVTGKGQTVGSTTLAIGYGYDSAGRLGTITLPSGNVVSYGYNTNGQVTSVTLNGATTILSGITYDPFGPMTGWTWGNGTTASRGFDTDGKITQVDNANGASLKNYGYDDAFRITDITDAGNSALSWTYGYDLLDRLTSATSSSVAQGWSYDANGNRLTETGSTPSTYTNSGTSNRVSSISGSLPRTYVYDDSGNTLSYAGATFTYNNRGRMVTAANGGATATYTYNALGQRVKRTTSSATALYVYDEAGHLAGEYSAEGDLIQETVWMGDIPVATLRPNGAGGVITYYVHTDQLNTPRLVTDVSNNIRWRWDSDAFGTSSPNANPSGLGSFEYNLRFPGQQFDEVIGLHYNYFRDLDPATGRYVESDPVGLKGGTNTYNYVHGDPVRFADPLGLWVKRCARKLGDRNSEPLDARRPTGIYHQYLSVSGTVLSFTYGSNPFWGQGRLDSNENPDNGRCHTVCDDPNFDKYVLAYSGWVPTYCPLAFSASSADQIGPRNCQGWVTSVLNMARRDYLANEPCPKCFR